MKKRKKETREEVKNKRIKKKETTEEVKNE